MHPDVEPALGGVHIGHGPLGRHGHVGGHRELDFLALGLAAGVLGGHQHLVHTARHHRLGDVVPAHRGDDVGFTALAHRHVHAVELQGHGVRIEHRRTGVNDLHAETDGQTGSLADNDGVGRDGGQDDVVHMVDLPRAAGATGEHDAARAGREGHRETTRRSQFDALPGDLHLGVLGELGLEFVPAEILDPQAPGRIAESWLCRIGIGSVHGAVAVEILIGEGAGLHGQIEVGVRAGQVPVRRLVVLVRAALGARIGHGGQENVVGPQWHRELGDQFRIHADADAHHVLHAVDRGALPGVKADGQTGGDAFLGQTAARAIAGVAVRAGAGFVVRAGVRRGLSQVLNVRDDGVGVAGVVEAEAVRRLGRAAADAEIALEGEGLHDQAGLEVLEQDAATLAATGVGDGEVAVAIGAGRATIGPPFGLVGGNDDPARLGVGVEVEGHGAGKRRQGGARARDPQPQTPDSALFCLGHGVFGFWVSRFRVKAPQPRRPRGTHRASPIPLRTVGQQAAVLPSPIV